jgi:hypothetical protein
MRIADAAKGFFRGHKPGPKEPSIFDTSISDWLLDLVGLALVVLVVGTLIRWAYVAIVR